MRVNKPNYAEISRRSVRADFAPRKFQREIRKERPQSEDVRRIVFVNPNSGYFKYKNLLLGKQVRLLREAILGGWFCEFLNDHDRKAVNDAAGWSNEKREYLFDGVKFK
jgi:hypothetical protein